MSSPARKRSAASNSSFFMWSRSHMLTATYSCLSRIHNCLASSASRPTHCCRTSTPVCVIGGGGGSPPPIPVESVESAALRPCRSRPPLSDISDADDDTELRRLWLPEPIPSDREWRPRPSSPSTHLKQVSTINKSQCVSYGVRSQLYSATQVGETFHFSVYILLVPSRHFAPHTEYPLVLGICHLPVGLGGHPSRAHKLSLRLRVEQVGQRGGLPPEEFRRVHPPQPLLH